MRLRFIAALFSIGIVILLVAAGLNLSNQGIYALTKSNPGPVIAVHIGKGEKGITALGTTYEMDQDLLKKGSACLQNAANRYYPHIQGFCHSAQQEWQKVETALKRNSRGTMVEQ